ncbi:MAG: septum formation initiator family protein [Oscillospiraceae bacterium]
MTDNNKKYKLSKNSTNKKYRRKKKRKLSKILGTILTTGLIVYVVATVVVQRSDIAKMKTANENLQAKITQAQQQNDEYTRLLKKNDEKEYMKQIAIERLGYAYPNERRFYIVDAE